jgi:hypothetical protein
MLQMRPFILRNVRVSPGRLRSHTVAKYRVLFFVRLSAETLSRKCSRHATGAKAPFIEACSAGLKARSSTGCALAECRMLLAKYQIPNTKYRFDRL